MRQLVRRREGDRVVGEVDIDVGFSRKEGVNPGDVRVGHRLAEHDALGAAVEVVGEVVVFGVAVVSLHQKVVHFAVGERHDR